MPPLHDLLGADALSGRHLWAAGASVALEALARGTSLSGALQALHGRSVLVAMKHQLATALALIELDGVADRLVLCPPGLSEEHRSHVIAGAGVDAIVSDGDPSERAGGNALLRVAGGSTVRPAEGPTVRDRQTEWIMLTSGTSGAPKMVLHGLESLTGAIERRGSRRDRIVWGTFYDIRRFGGLQILLRSILCGGSLVLSDAAESMGLYLKRAGSLGVTHISGTPSQWRNALAYATSGAISPRYIRLSGEIADRAILDALRARYPQADVVHAYASTEAGVGFEVDDGREGFPAHLIGGSRDVDLKLLDGSLRVRSARAASRYVGGNATALKDADGFIDSGDLVERRGERCYFVGRRGGIINVGGLKVHPEEVEAIINRHPDVRASLVRSRRNLITGSIVIADVVLRAGIVDAADRTAEVKREILTACREALANYKVPAAIRFVAALDVAATGKSVRHVVSGSV
ncbi:MAG TPA: fatty acid--CoA ligase family protein [Xanthobacteraceae bacterium]|nr:fatty acid--CoA ligase family protein [Xanthobacteraceae bacterium]